MQLSGKTVLVSGGNGGIGSAVVKELHKNGAVVYSLDLDGEIPNVILGVHYLSADLTNSKQLKDAIQLIKSKVDIVFLNAGIMRRGTIFDSSEEDYDVLLSSNLKSAWMLLKLLKPHLVEEAMIVQMSSGHALYPEADPGIYTLTKKATAALAEIVAITCPDYDVKVVYPGPILTYLLLTGRSDTEKKRISKIAMRPESFAEKVIELMQTDKKTLKFVPKNFSYELS